MSDYNEQMAEVRAMLRAAMDVDVAKYDQNLAGYKDILRQYIQVADVAYHELDADLVIPAVGAVIDQSTQMALAELTVQKVLFDMGVLLACAIEEILRMDHERIGATQE